MEDLPTPPLPERTYGEGAGQWEGGLHVATGVAYKHDLLDIAKGHPSLKGRDEF